MDFLSDLGIVIKNQELLLTALTHSSYANEENVESYERLEFLGDAVLELATSEYFYLRSSLKEGDMSKVRASYVCENALVEYSNKIGLTPNIRTGNGVSNETPSIVADCFESVLAVIFLEHGFSFAKKYALNIIVPYVENNVTFIQDYKSYLQEMVQMEKKSLEYIVIKEDGPAHDKTFLVDVIVDGIKFGTGVGKSKKEAEQMAAKDAISKIA
ncbi:MAG: ribonuclease III [Erysipelotrichales bacterium]|nr:ribonuclease III [Erysipelotrichales bacterium]